MITTGRYQHRQDNDTWIEVVEVTANKAVYIFHGERHSISHSLLHNLFKLILK